MAVSRIAVTMGDACGIGPEIAARLFGAGANRDCFVVGDLGTMRRAARLVDPTLPVAWIESAGDLDGVPPRCVPVLVPDGLPDGLADLPPGVVDARAGRAAVTCIECAVGLATGDAASAIVTAPVHKEALAAAGVPFPGHTEMLQALAGRGGALPPVRMMLANPELRVVLVTIHQSLRSAIDAIDVPRVLETIRIADAAHRRTGSPSPRIAVAGLNPHAGEGGLFGDEETLFIAPAIAAARADGIDASGPHPPDTVFMRARHAPGHPGAFDVVVAMTHDHGLIPVKYLGVDHGVNVTLGLPFVRTSPDHGTAFDIAWRGIADPASLVAAVEMARQRAAAR